jgi:hypothetical protein
MDVDWVCNMNIFSCVDFWTATLACGLYPFKYKNGLGVVIDHRFLDIKSSIGVVRLFIC